MWPRLLLRIGADLANGLSLKASTFTLDNETNVDSRMFVSNDPCLRLRSRLDLLNKSTLVSVQEVVNGAIGGELLGRTSRWE